GTLSPASSRDRPSLRIFLSVAVGSTITDSSAGSSLTTTGSACSAVALPDWNVAKARAISDPEPVLATGDCLRTAARRAAAMKVLVLGDAASAGPSPGGALTGAGVSPAS